MAKRLTEAVVDRGETGTLSNWHVYVDHIYDADIQRIEGVFRVVRDNHNSYLIVYVDPRYDWDEIEQEIIECCR